MGLNKLDWIQLRVANRLDTVDTVDGLHPVTVRETRGHFLGDFRVLLEFTSLQIGIDHHTRTKTALGDDVGRVGQHIAENTDLRGDVDVVIRRAPESSRSQTIAVEAGTELLTVAEDEQRRTVPRLLHTGVVIVEIVNFRERRIELRVVAVRLRHEQHHRLSRSAASADKELSHSVEVGGVRRSRATDRAEFLLTSIPDRVVHISFLRRHPVQVTLKGVDLTVVAQEAHGLRERPLRRRVGGETTVVNGKLRLVFRIFQILVELAQDSGAKHTLVHDGARAERANVEALSHLGVGVRLLFARLTSDEKLALELFAVQAGAIEEDLFVHRARQLGERTDDSVVNRNRAPAEHLEAFGDAALFKQLLCLCRLGTILRQHDHTDRGGAFSKPTDAVRSGPLLQELPRNVRHHADTITGVVVGGACAAVLHATDRGQRVLDGLVRALTLQRGDETDTARIVFFQKLRVVDRTTLVHRPIAVHGASFGEAHRRALTSRKAHRSALRERRGLTEAHQRRRVLLCFGTSESSSVSPSWSPDSRRGTFEVRDSYIKAQKEALSPHERIASTQTHRLVTQRERSVRAGSGNVFATKRSGVRRALAPDGHAHRAIAARRCHRDTRRSAHLRRHARARSHQRAMHVRALIRDRDTI